MVSHCEQGGREVGKEEEWEQCHHLPQFSPFWSGQAHRSLWGGLAATAGLVMLCRHEILMVEESKEGGWKEAGSNPPSKEGEEAPKKQGTKDSPQASQSHRQLGDWCPSPRFCHWLLGPGCDWCCPNQRVIVHFMSARQVFHGIDPPRMSTCGYTKREKTTWKSR